MADLFDDTAVTSFIRHLLGETVEKHWADTEITIYKNAAMVAVGARYWYLLFPQYKTYADVNMVSGTATLDIPDDAQRNTVCVYVKDTGRMLHYIEENELYKYEFWNAGNPVIWLWQGDKIYVRPDPSTSTTEYFRIWYMEHRNAIADFPEQLRPLIAVQAALLAKAKDDNIDSGLMRLYDMLEETAMIALHIPTIQEPTMIGDSEQSDAYASSLEG